MSLPSRNTLHLFGLLVLVTLTLLGACAAPEIQRRTDLFWPLPPDPPRISFVMSLSEPRDMGVRRGFFRRATEFLFGREEPPRLIRPHSVFSDGRGRLYVSDTGLQVVHVFDLDRRSYRQVFRIPGGRLLSPIGVAVDPQGRLFVSDSELDRVVVFDERGRYTRSLGEADTFIRVAGIALSPDGSTLYAVDAGSHKVHVFDPEGEKRAEFGRRGGGPGEFNFPSHITVDRQGRVYVADSLNFRIQIFDQNGTFIRKFGQLGNTLGSFSKPKGVAVDREGHVYVVDGIYDTVQVFNGQGELLIHFGSSGTEEGRFWLPVGIYADAADRIYVADTYNHRVQVFEYLGEENQ